MLPTMDSPLTDFQELYRVHIHENLVLRENMRDLEKQQIKRWRDMKVESNQFKNQYSKYLKNGRARSLHDVTPKGTYDGEANISVSRDMICKNCPYSFETWNNLCDVNRNDIDAYKSEVLFGDHDEKKRTVNGGETEHSEHLITDAGRHQVSMVTEVPVIRAKLRSGTRRLSASASNLLVLTGRDSRSPKTSPRLKRSTKENTDASQGPRGRRITQEVSAKDIRRLSFERSNTMPSIDGEHRATGAPQSRTTNSPPDIHLEDLTDYENAKPGSRLSLSFRGSSSGAVDSGYNRARSYTIDNHQRPVLLAKRKNLDAYLGERRTSFGTVALKAMADSSKGLTKFKYLTKLLAHSLKDLPPSDIDMIDNDSSKDNKSLPDIYESFKNCRYLRSPPRSRRGSNDLGDTLLPI